MTVMSVSVVSRRAIAFPSSRRTCCMSSPMDFSKSSIRLPISSILLMMDDDIVLNRPCICSNRFCTNSVKSAALSGTVSALKSKRWSAIVFKRSFCLGKDSSATIPPVAKSVPRRFLNCAKKLSGKAVTYSKSTMGSAQGGQERAILFGHTNEDKSSHDISRGRA